MLKKINQNIFYHIRAKFFHMTVGAISFGFISFPLHADTQLDLTKTLLKQWIQAENSLSKERSDWLQEKNFLAEMFAVLNMEKKSLNQQITEIEQQTNIADQERLALLALQRKYHEEQNIIKANIIRLQTDLQTLLPYLPDILQQELASMPKVNTSQDQFNKLSKQTEEVISKLSKIEFFNTQITVIEELRTMQLDQGNEYREIETIAVNSLYLGLGQAYYVSSNEQYAGIGYPTKEGWKWQEIPELATSITEAIMIHQSQLPTSLISLPVQLR